MTARSAPSLEGLRSILRGFVVSSNPDGGRSVVT
jgi:hypothetical protein